MKTKTASFLESESLALRIQRQPKQVHSAECDSGEHWRCFQAAFTRLSLLILKFLLGMRVNRRAHRLKQTEESEVQTLKAFER